MSDETTPATSLREDLAAVMQEIEQRDSAATGDTAAVVVDDAGAAAPVVEDDAAAAAAAARSDGRDDRGRFAAKAKGGEDGAAAQPAAQADAGAAQADEAAAGVQGEADAPSSWRANAKAAWDNVPPEARAEIHRREREVAQIAGRMDGERRFGRDFAEIMRPHMETIKGFGVSPQFAVSTLLNNDRILRSGTPDEKLAVARNLVADYGLDLNALLQPDPNFPNDPHVRNLQAQIAQMQRQLTRPAQDADAAPLPDAPLDDTQQEIEAFRTDPAHPHFDQVMPTMLALIESGQAPGLAEAYDQAVWANPALRSTLQGATPPAAQRQATASHNAAARRAAVSVPASPGAAGASKPVSLRDELRENMRQAGISV